MADFADLADLERGSLTDPDHAADRQGHQVDAGGGDVLGERTRANVQAGRDHLLDRFGGQERDLAVPVAGVGVTFEAPIEEEGGGLEGRLAHGLARAEVDRNDQPPIGRQPHPPSPLDHRPDLPPSLSSTPRPSTVMPRSTALHMS